MEYVYVPAYNMHKLSIQIKTTTTADVVVIGLIFEESMYGFINVYASEGIIFHYIPLSVLYEIHYTCAGRRTPGVVRQLGSPAGVFL